ncbi:MAG: pantoate--beta-alanine ligase [Chloroflexi bacterium]|nr:pantoate--beta-alanine ligase [Chloroflexota bacterium]
MKVIETIAEMKKVRRELQGDFGFVPTMGYLHDGHLDLARRAKAENPIVVASIFVNPTQFGPKEDLAGYPRDIPHDLKMLESVKTDFVFIPSAAEMYPPSYNTWVIVEKVTERLEGATRPGHFKGVATVVAKLFNIVQPTRSYFGQKDAQQVVVIKKMVADLNMNLEVVVCPTVREEDGLAMSSRNTYLKPDERKAAAVLYQSLKLAERLYTEGERNAETIRRKMRELIQKQPLANIDYISIADNETLEELNIVKPPALVSLVVKIGKPRLLDNIVLT